MKGFLLKVLLKARNGKVPIKIPIKSSEPKTAEIVF